MTGLAEVELRAAVAAEPLNAAANFALGRFLVREFARDPTARTEADAVLQRAVSVDPLHARAWQALALVSGMERRDEVAVANFERSLELEPSNGMACLGLGRLYRRLDNKVRAAQAFERAAQLQPDNLKAQMAAADGLMARGRLLDVSEAERFYRNACALAPAHAMAHHGLGLALGARAQHSEAAQSLIDAVALAPANAHAHLNLGVALVSNRRFAAAADAFAMSASLNPVSADARAEHAQALSRLKRRAEAEVSFSRAFALRSQEPNASIGPEAEGLADVLLESHRVTEAVEHLSMVLDLDPSRARASLRRGHALLALGGARRAEATDAFARAAQLNKKDYEAPILQGLTLELAALDGGVASQTLFKPACDAYTVAFDRCPPDLFLQLHQMLAPPAACDLQSPERASISMSSDETSATCEAGNLSCWDQEQRRVSAGWKDDNICGESGDVVLAEPCTLFTLRRRVLFGRLDYYQHKRWADGSESSFADQTIPLKHSVSSLWQRCLPCMGMHTGDTRKHPDAEEITVRELTNKRIPWPSEFAEAAQAALTSWGIVRVLREPVERSFQKELLLDLFSLAARVDASRSQYVHRARFRHHLRLRPDETPAIAFGFDVLARIAIQALPAGASDGLITELGALLTNPGARPQRWHADFGHPGCDHCAQECEGNVSSSGGAEAQAIDCGAISCQQCLRRYEVEAGLEGFGDAAPIYSCQLLILSAANRSGEVSAGTGNLEVTPGTHEAGGWRRRAAAAAEPGWHTPWFGGELPGTVVCYDGSAQHRGAGHGGAPDAASRVVLYMSVAGRGRLTLAGTAMLPSHAGLRVTDLVGTGVIKPAATGNNQAADGAAFNTAGHVEAVGRSGTEL